MSEKGNSQDVNDTYVIDVRSDVLTQPTDAMRRAMMTATTQDDVFREDPTVKELETKMAAMLGMESALFVPSGTMGNLISVLCHCDGRGQEAIIGHDAHLIVFEQGGVAQLGGVMPRAIPNLPDGTFDLDELENYVRADDQHYPRTALVAVENTHGNCGGTVLPLEWLSRLRAMTKDLGLPVHMDGARVLNAAVALDMDVKEIMQYVDSVSVCLSKGVGAPIGSVIAGTSAFVAKAIRLRKALGAGWRKPGPLAAAALVALGDYRQRLAADHSNARAFAQGIMSKELKAIHIDLDNLHTNLVTVQIRDRQFTAHKFTERLETVTEDEARALGARIKVRTLALKKFSSRLVFCHNNSADDVPRIIKKVEYVVKELTN